MKLTKQPRGGRNQVMRALLDGPEQGMPMHQMMELLGASRSTLVTTVSWLIKHQWVTRELNENEDGQSLFFFKPTLKGKNWVFERLVHPTISWGDQSRFRRAVLTVLIDMRQRFLTPHEVAARTEYKLSTVEKFFDWACGLRLMTGRLMAGQTDIYEYKLSNKGAALAEEYLKSWIERI